MNAPMFPGIPQLTGVVETPVFRRDGTFIAEPGYDPSTRIYYEPIDPIAAVPDRPNYEDDIVPARELLLEAVCDFPFADSAHAAAWLAMILTPFLRPCFNAAAPLFLIEANIRGSGKSLLANASALIITGRAVPAMTLPQDEDEQRKRITSIALAGAQLVLLDNVSGELGGDALNSILTATRWSDRLLGTNKMAPPVPLYATWIATGNNAQLGKDMHRRTVTIRIESPVERPEERTGFLHPNLLTWVEENRPRLVAAILTIIRGWYVAGKPTRDLPEMGSYPKWSSLVRQIVVWAGMPDPLLTQKQSEASNDSDRSELLAILEGMAELVGPGTTSYARGGMTSREILVALEKDADHPLAAALLEIMPDRQGRLPNAKAFSYRLKKYRGRPGGGRKLVGKEQGRGGRTHWVVLKCEDAEKSTQTEMPISVDGIDDNGSVEKLAF